MVVLHQFSRNQVRNTGQVSLGNRDTVNAANQGCTQFLILEDTGLSVEGEVTPLAATGATDLSVCTRGGSGVLLGVNNAIQHVDFRVRKTGAHSGWVHFAERDGV